MIYGGISCGEHRGICRACKERPTRKGKNATLCEECYKEKMHEGALKSAQTRRENAGPKPSDAEAQQSKFRMAYDREQAARCGYGNGDVRIYTPEEIAKIAGEITPIHAIKNRSWTGYESLTNWVG